MTRITSLLAVLLLSGAAIQPLFAGNPDRQGEAGAYELLLNPWARSAGLNGLVTARATGVEALYFNPAGIGRMNPKGMELMLSRTQYLVGTGLNINAFGYGQNISNNAKSSGSIGVTLMSLGFGEIPLTTVNQPEGVGTFKPSFFNLGVSYGHVFKDKEGFDKISVGFTMRVVSESIANANASGVCFDAGVQYVTGADRQLRFGIALRNIGSKMRYRGEGLSYVGIAPNQSTPLTVQQRTAGFDMPSLLHIGASYDFLAGKNDSTGIATQRLTTVFNFTANSYSRDQLGLGLEYAFREMFMARVGYKYESGMYSKTQPSGTVASGLTAGVSIETPFSRKNQKRRISFDYAFEYTRVFSGSHSFGIKLLL